MIEAKQKRHELHRMLSEGRLIVAPGAHNGLSAKLVEQAGFPAVYMSGSGVANTLTGGPDVGLLTMTEMVGMARFLSQAVDVPVISDADTGYGNAVNVMRTVREFEAAGVAAIHIEDQVSPKRCGSVVGKEVIDAAEMVGKIRAARDARADPDFVIIARTDARGPLGLNETIRRGQLYAEAGADMIFPDALLSEVEYARFAAEVPGPKLLNLGGYGRKRTTPKMPFETIERMGYGVVILPLAALRVGVRALMDFLDDLARDGEEAEKRQIAGFAGHPVENWYEFTGMGDVRALEEAYLPADTVEAKYKSGAAGHMPGER